MARDNWWLNRAGKFARYSNPQGGPPAYGVSMDVGTAPWSSQGDYQALIDYRTDEFNGIVLDSARALGESNGKGWGAISWGLLSQGGIIQNSTVKQEQIEEAIAEGAQAASEDDGNWFTDITGGIGGAVDWAQETVESGVRHVPGGDTAWDVTEDVATSKWNPLTASYRQAMAASQKFDEGVSTLLTAAAVAEDRKGNQWGNLFEGSTWSEAHDYVKTNHLNMGEAVTATAMSAGQEKNLLTDIDRLNNLRKNSGWFNAAGVASSIAITWKADPLVLLGRGAGFARNLRRGDIMGDGAAQALQRDIIGSATKAEAEAKVLQQTNITDRLYGNRALSLFDRLEGVRESSKKMEFSDFVNAKPFHQNTNGRVMAGLIAEADDTEWGTLKRYLLGDPNAKSDMISQRGEITSKIKALETFHVPKLQEKIGALEKKADDLELEDWYLQLGDLDKAEVRGRVLTGPEDWLDSPLEEAKAQLDDLKGQLSTYAEHDNWFNRVLAGVGEGDGPMVSSGGEANVVFGGLDTISKPTKTVGQKLSESRFTRDDLDKGKSWRGEDAGDMIARQNFLNDNPSMHVWQHDWLSPKSVVFKLPRTWFQRTNHLVNFHETDKSVKALAGWMQTLETTTGRTDIARRNQVLESYAKAMSEQDRQAIVKSLQEEGIRMVGQKYGLNDDMLKELAGQISDKHGQGWQRLKTNNYSTVKMEDGQEAGLIEWFQGDAKVSAQMPMSTAELANSERLVNLQDIDHAIRRHKDILKEMSDSQDWMTRAKGKGIKTRRQTADVAMTVMEMFNAVWKPLALVSLRWPLRVIGDENTRWSLLGASAMMREAYHGSRNFAYNNGIVRPYEFGRWADGQMRKVASVTDDALNPKIFDVADTKMNDNPAGQMPFDIADLDNMDDARYMRLGQQLRDREDEYRSQVVAKAQGGQPQRSRWAQQFEDRVHEAERTRRGFMVDPITEKAMTKGWATSVYPGRMRTLGAKPNADDYRLFANENLDILQNKRNRVAVWYDDDLQAWVMDVVRPHGKMDSALKEASAAGVDHAYDVGAGFQRMVWEDDPLGNWREGMAPVKQGIHKIDPVSGKVLKRKVGSGAVKVRTLDGKRVEFSNVFGPDVLNGNMSIEGMRSINAVEGYFGSGTRMGENLRGMGLAGDYKTITPNQRRWADATAEYANKMVRKDAVWRRMLQGQTDAQVRGWLKSADGRLYRERMGIGAMRDPDSFINEKRTVLEQHFPGPAIQAKMRDANITKEDVEALIPERDRHDIHGATISQLSGDNPVFSAYNKAVQAMYRVLGSKISDNVTRHPMGAAMYRMKLQNLVARYESQQMTNSTMKGLEAQARAFATKQVRRYMFDMSDELNGVRAFRFVAPFFNAQVEVVERYLKLLGEHPEALGKLFGVANSTAGDHGPFMQTVSSFEDGMQETDEWKQDGFVVTQMPDFMMKKFGLSKVYKDLPIPTSSVNLIFQGDSLASSLAPSWGPMVTIPAAEWIKRRNKPEDYASSWFKELFPFGMPRDALDAVLPAWAKRVRTLMDKSGDPAYGTEVSEAYRTLYADWEMGGRKGAEPTRADAESMVENLYKVRAVAGFVSPVPINPNGKYQFYIDQYREFMDKDPTTADKKFYEQYGPELFRFAASSSKLNMDLAPNELAAAAWSEHKGLMEQAPLLAGVIAGPGAANGEYNYDIYRWQLGQSTAPGSNETIREKLTPEEALQQNNVDRGWIEYNKLMTAVDVELQRRGLVTLQAVKQKAIETTGSTDPAAMEAAKDSLLDAALQTNYAADLRRWRAQEIDGISERNTGWEDAYNSRETEMGEFIVQARKVVDDPSMENRVDVQGLNEYLTMRDKFTTELMRREQMGMSGSLTAEENADLAVGWYTATRRLINTNLLFGDIFHRWLEDDDLSLART